MSFGHQRSERIFVSFYFRCRCWVLRPPAPPQCWWAVDQVADDRHGQRERPDLPVRRAEGCRHRPEPVCPARQPHRSVLHLVLDEASQRRRGRPGVRRLQVRQQRYVNVTFVLKICWGDDDDDDDDDADADDDADDDDDDDGDNLVQVSLLEVSKRKHVATLNMIIMNNRTDLDLYLQPCILSSEASFLEALMFANFWIMK